MYRQTPRAASVPGLRPRPPESTPRARLAYGSPDSDVKRLRDDVHRLERLVLELCGALVYSDDIALLERTTAGLGPIYRDASFSATRTPIFARNAIERVLVNRALVATPPAHVWTPVSNADERWNREN